MPTVLSAFSFFTMEAFQGNIYIENGKIKVAEPAKGYIQIFEGNSFHKFENCFIFPGFVDSHCHLLGLGEKISEISLENCESPEECAIALTEAKPRNNWLIARGWNQEKWNKLESYDKKLLDFYFPDIPIFFIRIDGHCAWVNSKALEIAGINNLTPDPEGGKILRYKSGEPNGLLIDNAINLVANLIPKYARNEYKEFIKKGAYECLKYGITEIHDMDVNPDFLDIYYELDKEGLLPLKINIFLSAQNYPLTIENFNTQKINNVNIIGLKFFMDGALGSRGAALSLAYKDQPNYKGLILINKFKLIEKVKKGIDRGFDIAIHAIGDKANKIALDIYENVYQMANINKVNLRIEHAQIVSETDLERFSKFGVLASVQPIHCISDASMAEKRLPPTLLKDSYRWKSFIDKGIKVIAGSDFPVESPDPLLGIYAFINRIPFDSQKPWFPKEKISIEEALKAYIITPRQIISQDIAIEPLKIADFIVVNNNFSKELSDETRVLGVYTNGIFYDFREKSPFEK